jgi:type II secretory pathway component HofQ
MLLSGCAPGQKFLESGNERVVQGDLPGAIRELELAVKAEPDNLAYRAQLIRLRQTLQNKLLAQADQARAEGRFDDAAGLYQQVLSIEPANPRARDGADGLTRDRKHAREVEAAHKAIAASNSTRPCASSNWS